MQAAFVLSLSISARHILCLLCDFQQAKDGPRYRFIGTSANDVGQIVLTRIKDVEALEREGFRLTQKLLDLDIVKLHSDLLKNVIGPGARPGR